MSAAQARSAPAGIAALLRAGWERMTVYLPIILMAVIALGTYWLARNTPAFGTPETPSAATHDRDYFMRGFSVKTYDASGRLKSEVYGSEARHFPDTVHTRDTILSTHSQSPKVTLPCAASSSF